MDEYFVREELVKYGFFEIHHYKEKGCDQLVKNAFSTN